MDYYMSAGIMFCLLSLSSASPPVTYKYALQPGVGKPRLGRPRRPPGIVNYTAIEDKIAAKNIDLENKIDEKIVQFKRIVMGKLNRTNEKIKKTRSETEKGIKENRKGFEASIDERFARLERVAKARLDRGDRETETIRNKTIENSKSIIENRRNLRSRIDLKIERLKGIVMGELKRNDVEIEKIRNETEKGINETRKDFEARIDERFATLKRIVDERLDRGDKEIEKIRNEITNNSKSIEENQRNMESRIHEKIVQFKATVLGKLMRSNEEIEKIRNKTVKAIRENQKDLENGIGEKIKLFKGIVNGKLEESNVEIEKIRNETENANNVNRKDLEARIDESFERLEKIVVERLEEGGTEIEKIQNETTKNSESIEETRKRAPIWSSCDDVPRSDHESRDGNGGIFNIIRGATLYEVYCDMTTDGGGWTVFQRRMDGSVDFYRNWEDYERGFGNKSGEFWLGLEAVHQLTQNDAYELRIDLSDFDGSTAYAQYGTFSVSGRSDNYTLTVGEYSGTAGDALYNNNKSQFSAKNKDVDRWNGGDSCAIDQHGAWWFNSCGASNLNGRYNDTSGYRQGVYWYYWKQRNPYSLKGSEMKFRKK